MSKEAILHLFDQLYDLPMGLDTDFSDSIKKTVADMKTEEILDQRVGETDPQYIARVLSEYSIRRGMAERISDKGYEQAIRNIGYQMAMFSFGFPADREHHSLEEFCQDPIVREFSGKIDAIITTISLSSGRDLETIYEESSVIMNNYLNEWVAFSINN